MNGLTADSVRLVEIVGVNLVLSGDNALVVGLAIRKLPARQRKIVSSIGVPAAVAVQVVATLTLASILHLPLISALGGVLLGWIAIRLLHDNDAQHGPLADRPPSGLVGSVATLFGAYLVMSVDNVLAIAAVGEGHPGLLTFGLVLSCALLVPGSLVVAALMRRYPVLVRIGGGVLGWTAGTMIAAALTGWEDLDGRAAQLSVSVLMTIIVMSSPSWWRNRRRGEVSPVATPSREDGSKGQVRSS